LTDLKVPTKSEGVLTGLDGSEGAYHVFGNVYKLHKNTNF
jgi:hypothetical protein